MAIVGSEDESRIEGRILFDHGRPADGIAVRLYHRSFGCTATLLGETRTDERGSYSLPYKPVGNPANLEVRVADDRGEEVSLSATRYCAQSREVFNLVAPASVRPLAAEYQRLRADLERHLGERGRLDGARENPHCQDISLLRCATHWDARLIVLLALAARLSDEIGIEEDVLYALFRTGLPTDKQLLAHVSVAVAENALRRAAKANIVSLSEERIASAKAAFASFAQEIRRISRATGALSSFGDLLDRAGLTQAEQAAFENVYLDHQGTAAELWQAVAKAGLSTATIGKLQLQGKLAYLTLNNADLAAAVQKEVGTPEELASMVDKDLHREEAWKERLLAMAGKSDAGLQKLIPPAYQGETTADRLHAYGADLARKVRQTFPTRVVARMIEKDVLHLGERHDALKAPVSTFLKNAEALGYSPGQVPFNKFVAENHEKVFDGVPKEDIPDTAHAAKKLHRLYQITPTDEALQLVLGEGFTSAYDVATLPYETFLESYGDRFSSDPNVSRNVASQLYRKAQQVTTVTYNFFTAAKQMETAPTVYAISAPDGAVQEAKKGLIEHYPTMESLFGSLDFCECEHCRSVLSPAAYLVDLLQFLDPDEPSWNTFLTFWRNTHNGQEYTDQHKKAYDVLIERRPDLPHLPLTCENTNTALPYIDIVNEILEYYVAKGHLDAAAVHDTGKATTSELLAEPQNILREAYNDLKAATYPIGLPFDLWLETVRRFCDHFGLPLWRVLEVLDPAPGDLPAVFIEYLGLSPAEHATITGAASLASWHLLYGFDDQQAALAELASAKALARRLGVSYKQLIDLVRTDFVNSELGALVLLRKLGVDVDDVFKFKSNGDPLFQQAFQQRLDDLATAFPSFDAAAWLDQAWQDKLFDRILVLADPDTGCNFDATTLRYADGTSADALALIRINLFVRLWKKLGWTIEETDRALRVFLPASSLPLTAANLGEALSTALIYLAHFKRLDETVKAGSNKRLKLLTLWSNLPTTGSQPLYAQLFLTRNVLKQDAVFDDPLGNYLSQSGVPIKDHLLALQAALSLTASEIAIILADAGQGIDTAGLSLENVSLLYRYGLLAKALKLSVQELIALKSLSGLDPFKPLGADPLTTLDEDYPFTQTLRFLAVAASVKESGFHVEDLDYLFRHRFDPVGEYRPNADRLLALVRGLALDLGRIRDEQAVPASLTDDLLRQRLALVMTPEALAAFAGALGGTADAASLGGQIESLLASLIDTTEYRAALAAVQPSDKLDPDQLADEPALRVAYDEARKIQRLTWRGLLPDSRKQALDDAVDSTVLAELLDSVQSQGKADAEVLISGALAMLAATLELTAVAQGVQPAGSLDPDSFASEPRVRVSYEMPPDWDPEIAYEADVAVAFGGSIWSARRANTDVEPVEGDDWTAAPGRKQGLTLRGLLSDAKKAQLEAAHPSAVLSALLADVRSQTDALLQELRVGILALDDFDSFFAAAPALSDAAEDPRARLARAVSPFAIRKLARQLVVQTLAASLDADRDLVEALLTDGALLVDPNAPDAALLDAFAAAGEQGLSATFLDANDDSEKRLVPAPDSADKPAGAKSVRFEGYLQVPAAGLYKFFALATSQNVEVELRLGTLPDPLLRATAATDGAEISAFVELKPDISYSFAFEAHNLDVGDAALSVQGDNLPKGSLARLALRPAETVERVRCADVLLAKSLQLIAGLGLTAREARHVLAYASDFGDVSWNRLPTREAADELPDAGTALFSHFLRLVEYTRLKREVAGDTDDLVGIFENARRLYPAAGQAEQVLLQDLCERFGNLARRELEIVEDAAGRLGFGVTSTPVGLAFRGEAPDFTNEKGIRRLWDVLQAAETLGVPVAAVARCTEILSPGKPQDERFSIASGLRDTVKARYETETWQRIAQPIFDKLRQRQRDALVAHVMHRDGFARIEELFEHFLLDPGMEPVVQTSRLRLAISSVQLFIQRCLLNLEPEVSPAAINSAHWEWMKRYRVWEANRKIFLFPENWLEPEFRDDKTHLFQELEGTLLAGDVSNDLVEDGFFTYLKQLEELARLDVVAMYCEEKPLDPASNTVHVIGRTFGRPHKYFYRRYQHRMWTPWEPVPVEIDGDHVVAVIWRQRLHLFWVSFLDKAKPAGEQAIAVDFTKSISVPTGPERQVDVQLSWSEYFQGEWTTRESSGFSRPITVDVAKSFDSGEVFIYAVKEYDGSGEEAAVRIQLDGDGQFTGSNKTITAFRVVSKNSAPEVVSLDPLEPFAPPYTLDHAGINRHAGSDLLEVNFSAKSKNEGSGWYDFVSPPREILGQAESFLLLVGNPPELVAPDVAPLISPFFFQDRQSTFFIEPTLTETTITEWEDWVIPVAQPKPKDDLPITAEVPEWLDPGGPVEIDPLALFEIQAATDWVTAPTTLLQFDQAWVGPAGGVDVLALP
ncbi:MAG: neuraminidase-like domain-containing protein [Thermoanaerobaculia bacterium]